jgi:hypothetical protein
LSRRQRQPPRAPPQPPAASTGTTGATNIAVGCGVSASGWIVAQQTGRARRAAPRTPPAPRQQPGAELTAVVGPAVADRGGQHGVLGVMRRS